MKASNTRASTAFWVSVALAGDTLAVGAVGEASSAIGINGPESDTSAGSSGAVYVFARNGLVWSQSVYAKASNTRTSASFGISVALSLDTLAVGAYGESSNATGINGNQADMSALGAGAVYVLR